MSSENGQDMDGQDMKDLAAAYALGALDPAEARSFEAFLATSRGGAARGGGVPRGRRTPRHDDGEGIGPGPSSDLRNRVLARVVQEKVVPLKPRHRWTQLDPVGSGRRRSACGRAGAPDDRASPAGGRAGQRAIAELQRDFGATQAQLAAREATLNAILEPDVRLTTLTSTSTPAPVIQLFMNPKKRVALIHAFNLQPTESGRVYQLWFIPKGGKPIPSVTFNAEPTWPRDGARGRDSGSTRPRRRRGDQRTGRRVGSADDAADPGGDDWELNNGERVRSEPVSERGEKALA